MTRTSLRQRRIVVHLLALLLVLASPAARTTPASPGDVLNDGPAGATCDRYDFAAGIAWRNRLGDWQDRDRQSQGERAFAEAIVSDIGGERAVEFDITSLVREWRDGTRPNFGILIRDVSRAGGTTIFHSREAADASLRPSLALTLASGRRADVTPSADTYLVCTTVRSLGTANRFQAGRDANAVLRFPVAIDANDPIERAVLRLTTTARQYGATRLGVFALDPALDLPRAERVAGLAARYGKDSGIVRDPDVLVAEDFESASWPARWSHVGSTPTFEAVAKDDNLRFEPLAGKALRVNVAKGQHLGLNMTYRFRDKTGREPDEIWFRYYLRFADDWRPTIDGGKLPGIAGTYNRGGWGGRKSDGENGWSMRGGFRKVIASPHPLAGGTPIGTYAYHPEVRGTYGEFWPWSLDGGGVLVNNRWYCIEQHVKLNTPGRHDGVLQVWIDGVPAFERRDIRVRDVDDLHIEEIWLNVYHGGTAVSPHDQHLFIDNIVVARRYIGPMGGAGAPAETPER